MNWFSDHGERFYEYEILFIQDKNTIEFHSHVLETCHLRSIRLACTTEYLLLNQILFHLEWHN